MQLSPRNDLRISAVIPVFNSQRTIEECLKGIKWQNEPFFQVIVVDDHSRDETMALLKGVKDIEVITLDENAGPAHARNIGARKVSGDIIFFVDSDIQLPPHAVQVIKKQFSRPESIAAVCGIYNKAPLINKNFIAQYRALQQHVWKKSGCGLVTRFACSLGAIRKDVLLEVGGFNEDFKNADVEDYEIGHRLLEKGCLIFQTPEIEAAHDDIYRWNDLVKSLFRRAYLYASLFHQRRKLDTGYLNKPRVLTYPTSLLAFLLILFSFYNDAFLFWGCFLWILQIILDKELYLTFYKERGFCFLLRCIPVHFIITWVMALGFLCGSIHFYIKKANMTEP